MTKAELKKIMNDNYIFEPEVVDAIQFVQDLLELRADEIERNEPYATNSIQLLRDAAREVWYLQEYVEDALEEG